MKTLYDLFKLTENATQEEIEDSYNKILKKADSLPQNEKIIEQIRRIKIAYGILSDPEKRKKYDLDLAAKRADELLKNIEGGPKEVEEKKTDDTLSQNVAPQISVEEKEIRKQQIKHQIEQMTRDEEEEQSDEEEKIRQQKNAEKLYKKQQRKNRRVARKEEQLKREMEIEAYGRYLEGQGYKVKYPWTWLRVKRLLISIISIIIACVIIWHIPFFRKALTDLYNENFIIQTIVNIIFSLINSITSLIKK